ncbi:MAG: insulinase family protein [Candidatus Obscuribacterales bacterium]|nr:insulinase family protein [Candidatus Obscuribacterales bacterium]
MYRARRFLSAVLSALLWMSIVVPVMSQSEADAGSAESAGEATPPVPRFSLPSAGALPLSDSEAANNSGGSDSKTSGSLPAVSKPNLSGAAAGTQTTRGASVAISTPDAVPLATIYRGSQTVPQEIVLPNGLKVLILENHEFPVVSTLVWYRVGSANESKGCTGLNHMVEHLMFQEVGQFKPGEIGSTIARLGGQFNGYTSDDFTTFFETLPSSRLELALKIESERMAHTTFSEAEVQAEVANIRKEFENEAKDPAALISKEVRALLFSQHPYHNPTIGWKSDVEGLTVQHASEFYQKYFRPNNATLIISGDVNGKNAIALVQKYFGKLASAAKTPKNPQFVEPALKAERRVSLKYAGNKEVAQVGYRAPAMDDPDAPAMVVLERLLNGGVNGRLRSKLIDSKLCSYSQASYEIKKDPGLFTITCTAVPATANAQAKILEAVDALVAQLREKAPSEPELKRARNQAEFAYFSECDGPYRAGFHLGYFDSLDKWQSAFTWAERIKSVTAADVQRVSQKYLANDSRVVAWIAGTTAAKPVVKQSASTEPTDKEKEKETPKAPSKPESRRLTGNSGRSKNHIAVSKAPAALGARKATTNSAKQRQLVAAAKRSSRSKKVLIANLSSRDLQHVKLTAFKENDEEPASKASKKPAANAKMALPPVIRNLPEAIGNAVTGNIPGTVGSVGSAIIGIPEAIGGIGSAVGNTASAIGKGIANLKGESQDPRIVKRTLKNGVELLVLPSKVSPVVQIAGSIQAGEAYVPKNRSGLSMIATSILNQGSSKRNKAQYTNNQDDLGITSSHMLKWENAIETIDFSSRCLSRDLGAQLDLIGESLSAPVLDDGGLEKAKAEASFLVKRNEEGAHQKVERVVLQNLLDDNSPYCPSDPGEKLKSMSQCSLADLQKFFAAHIVPGAMTLVLVGDVDADQAASQVEKAFENWNGRTSHAEIHAKIRTQRILRASLPLKESKKSSLCFAQIMPISESHPDFGSLLIADGVLVNHPMISRFEQALSRNSALEAAISNGEFSVDLLPVSSLSSWSLNLSLEPNAVSNAVKTIRTELRKFSREGITPEEFAETKRYLQGLIPVRHQATIGSIADDIVESAEHSDTAYGYTAKMSSIKNSSLESVNRLIKSVFRPDQSTVVIAGAGHAIKSARSSDKQSAADFAASKNR